MSTHSAQRPASVPAEAWWDATDEEWVLGRKDEAGKLHGTIEFWRADGTLCCRAPHEHGEPHGVCTRFHGSGEISQRCTYVGGTLHGTRSWFSIDGPTTENTRPAEVSERVRRSEMDYDMGDVTAVRHYDGEDRRVGADGTPFPEPPDGLPEGAWWDERVERWKLGRANSEAEKIGLWQVWIPGGQLLERCEYDADERHGSAWLHVEPERYGLPGVVAMRGRTHQGVQVGVWSFVDGDERVVRDFDYGDPVGDDVELQFFDDDPRPAPAWEDLAGKYRAARYFGLALAALARAAGVSGDVTTLRQALTELAAPRTAAAALAAAAELESVSKLIDGLVAGADAASVFRQIAIYLDQQDSSRAALEFIDTAMALAPDRHDYAFTRSLIHMSLGDVEAARTDARRIPDADERSFIENYLRILFPVFDFWPRKQKPHTHYGDLPEVPSRSLEAIRDLAGKYATRLQLVRERLRAIPELIENGEPPWMVPDLSALLPDGPVELAVDRFELPDPDEPDEPFVIDIDETLELDDYEIPALMRVARDEWHALCWLCWSCGLDRVELPTQVRSPDDFGQAAGMAPARLWRCRDRIHMHGTGAQRQGIPGFEWEGIDIDELPISLTRIASSEYEELQALMYWLTDPNARSPWQDNLRGS